VDDTTGTSVPQAINNQGQIVGVYADDLHAEVGFVLTNSTFVPLAAPGSFFQSYPWDIDDRGRIVGVIR
jgi:hypothetical protein